MMTKRFIVLISCLLHISLLGSGQTPSYQFPNTVQNEKLEVHLNTTFFLTGETLLFTIYCMNTTDNKLSTLSRVVYVELIGEDMKPFAQLKVKLENGIGRGDFFFHGKTPSANFTLLAYTMWMKNFPANKFFRETISVINPQLGAPTNSSLVKSKDVEQNTSETKNLEVQIDKTSLGSREKVTVQLRPVSKDMAVSVNVRPVEPEFGSRKAVADQETSITKTNAYLPDLRAEMITGTVVQKSNGKPLANGIVTLSAPSRRFQFITSKTDSTGRFYFQADQIHSEEVFLKIFGAHNDDFNIQFESPFYGDYKNFAPPKLNVDTSLQRSIKKRYLSTQVENAYYSKKKDSTLTPVFRRFFSPDKIYELDNFTRFPTMEDVFREIIPEVVVRARDGGFSFIIYNGETGFRFTNPPLVLLDGIPIADPNELMKYDPALIKTIALSTRHYFYGSLETDGIISVETFEGVAKNISLNHTARLKYIQPQPSRIYNSPDYSTPALNRIPDYRTQLYWNPAVALKASSSETIAFFTGDLPGKYFVEIVGLTSTGEKVYRRSEFEVK